MNPSIFNFIVSEFKNKITVKLNNFQAHSINLLPSNSLNKFDLLKLQFKALSMKFQIQIVGSKN